MNDMEKYWPHWRDAISMQVDRTQHFTSDTSRMIASGPAQILMLDNQATILKALNWLLHEQAEGGAA